MQVINESISESDFLLLARYIYYAYRCGKKLRFKCPIEAINYYRQMDRPSVVKLISNILEMTPGKGMSSISSWMNEVSLFVR